MTIRVLWGLATSVALLGTWLMFESAPGINWSIWVTTASLGLCWMAGRKGSIPTTVFVTGATAIAVACSAGFTANPFINALTVVAVILFLALQMLLTARPGWGALTLPFALTAPVVAFFTAMIESVRRAIDATNQMRSPAAGARVRGLAITVPVLVVFALLLAGADPVFAHWRDTVVGQLETWSFLPRAIFFVGLLGIVLGAYGFAIGVRGAVPIPAIPDWRVLGVTERSILLGGVAALFWLFLAIQVTYLFGTSPAEVGSGLTFSEYARRGFTELTVVATATVALIVAGEVFGRSEHDRGRLLRILTFAVLVAVFCLVASALNRVILYEEAYGYTTARLYGKTYMLAVALGLVALCVEVADRLDAGRLFRRSFGVATILFMGLAYWNHEAWIANRNIDRFSTTGEIDVEYLAHGLSLDAVPAIGARLPELPEPVQESLRHEMEVGHAARVWNWNRHWYEWNASRDRARRSLASDFGLTVAMASKAGSRQ